MKLRTPAAVSTIFSLALVLGPAQLDAAPTAQALTDVAAARAAVAHASARTMHWKPRPGAVPGHGDHQGPRDPDGRRRRAARRPGPARRAPTASAVDQAAPGDRHDHRLQQDRHRRRFGGARRAPTRRTSSSAATPSSPSTRAAPARREGQWGAFGAREDHGRERGDGVGARAALEQRQHGDDRRVVHGHQPDLRRRRHARRASRRSSRRCRAPTSTATWSPPAASSTSGSSRCGSGLVTGTGLIPPAYGAHRPAVSALDALLDRLSTATHLHRAAAGLDAMLGGDPAYDGPFYRERSPINVVEQGQRADVPGQRRVRPVPARHPAAVREPPEARRPGPR